MFTAEIEHLVTLTDAELHEHVQALELERRAADARFAAALAVANSCQLNAVVDGHRSMRSYLGAVLNYSTAMANRWLQTAAMVDAHPAVGEAWLDGHIGEAQATTFAATHANRRVRDRLGEFVPVLLESAERLSHREFAKCADRFTLLADPDGAHDGRDDAMIHRRGSVNEVGGTLDISAFGGDPLTASEMVEIHRRFLEAEYRKDVAHRRAAHGDDADLHDLARTNTQRSFDALIEIFRSANGATGIAKPMDYVVNLLVDDVTFARLLHESGLTASPDPHQSLDDLPADPNDLINRRCETSSGSPVHPHDVLRAALAGHVRRVVVDTNGVVVNMGRKTRLFTGSARIAAKLLVTRCHRPGCGLPAEFCEVDHNLEWHATGATDQANASILCGADNRQKHRQGWTHKRSTTGQLFILRADGTPMVPVGARPPIFPDESDEPDDPVRPDDRVVHGRP